MRDAIIQRLQRQLVECQEELAMERLAHVQNPMELLTMHVPTLQLEATGARRDADPVAAASQTVNPNINTTFIIQPTSEAGIMRLVITTSVVSVANGVTMTTTNTVEVPLNMMTDEEFEDEDSDNEDMESDADTNYDGTDHESSSDEMPDFIALAWGS
jgi:hypothetical protein